MPDEKLSKMSVQGISQDGTAPKRRIATVSAAMTANNSLMTAYRQGGRDIRFGRIAGLFAGFPPMPRAEMERQGMGDMPNVNTREFEAAVMDYADVWNAVNSGSMEFADIKAEHEDPMEAERRGKVLTECFNWAIGVWNDPPKDGFFNQSGKFIIESAVRDIQMALFSVGVSMWRDSIDFRFTTIPTRQLRLPDSTKITLENCSVACIDDDMSASQLWQMRGKEGWSKEQIFRVLYANQGARGILDDSRSTYAQWVEWARENESFILNDFTTIPFIHVYCQEFSGKISHVCFSQIQPGVDYGEQGKKEGDNFMYEAPESEWVDTWDQAICLFSDSVGAEGRYHGAKGFGDRNFDMCHFNNLMFNRTAASAIINNTLMFESNSEADKQKLDQITITHGAILLPELQLNQLKMDMDIGASMGIFDLSTRVRNVNNRKFPVGDRSKTGEAPTAAQVTHDAAKEAQFTNLQISFYRATGADKLFAEMYRRLAQPGSKYPESWPGGKVAKRFREKCKERGIPEGDLLKVYSVRANRNGGSGSMAMDVMKAEKLLAVATPGQGQWNARYELAAALKGADMAKAFVEPLPDQPTEISRRVSDENNFIADGKVPLALPNDPHEVHVPGHIEILSELQKIVMQIQEGGGVTPDNIDDAVLLSAKLMAGIQHTAQHLKYMSEMPQQKGSKRMYEEITKEAAKIVNEIGKMTQGLEEEIKKVAQESQQQQAQQSPEMVKAQAEVAIMQMKADAEIQIKQMIAEAKLGMDAIKSEAKTQQKMEDHQLKQGMEAERTLAGMEQQQAASNQKRMEEAEKAQQDLQIQAASSTIDLMAQAAKAQEAAKPKPETK